MSSHHPFQPPYAAPRSMPPPSSSFHQPPAAPPPPLRPLYFLSRYTGILVPLVPADELPFNVRLIGVPRVLRVEETGGMQHVGARAATGLTFRLERDLHTAAEALDASGQRSVGQPPAGFAPAVGVGHGHGHGRSQSGSVGGYLAPDAHARQALAHNAAAYAANQAPQPRPVSAYETAKTWRSGFNPPLAAGDLPTKTPAHPPSLPATTTTTTTTPTDQTQSLIDAILATTSGAQEAARRGYTPRSALPLPPAGALPDAEKKEYCTYWLRHGECDYMQQGCLYKHEMPDRETLGRIGFRGVPRWWAERQMLARPAGPVAMAGGVVKSSEWLRKGRGVGGGDGSDGGSESESGGGAGSESSGSSGGGEKAKVTVKERVRVATKSEPGREIPIRALKPAVAESPTPAMPTPATPKPPKAPPASQAVQPRAAAPPAIDIRKASTASDLIDFAVPLLPTPPSSAPSLTSSASSSPRSGQTTPLTPPTPTTTPKLTAGTTSESPSKAVHGKTTARIFVPRGESAEHHVADARKRQARQYARRGAPVSTLGGVAPLERQIGEMRKGRSVQTADGERKKGGKVARKEKGLMGSRHAPGARAREHRLEREQKVAVRTGLRVRRPAAPAPAPAKGVGAAPGKMSRMEGGGGEEEE
ncbi:hypothetical protein LTR53_015527 [Teratosphaeriaceae sp. CCFEE 6253]|nr:hypothetical protein LTR53_015527 [Teratosphaeriaceae sp. CCFEE 6253]